MENNRYKIEEVPDLPVDLRAPKLNSERWNLMQFLDILTTPVLGTVGFGFMGYSGGDLLHLNPYQIEGLVGLGMWLGAITGLYLATKPLLDSH